MVEWVGGFVAASLGIVGLGLLAMSLAGFAGAALRTLREMRDDYRSLNRRGNRRKQASRRSSGDR